MTAPAGEWWSEDQARAVMLGLGVDASRGWAERTFLTIEGALFCRVFDACGELRRWAVNVVDETTLDLIADAEWVAGELACPAEEQRQFIADRVGAFRARLDELVAHALPRGEA